MADIIQRVAAKAVIANQKGQVLILREAATNPDGTRLGRYLFPGGRIEPGEPFFDALAREVREETGLQIKPGLPLGVNEWMPVIHGQAHHIVALFVACEALSEDVILSNEHDHFAWIDPANHERYDLLEPEPLQVWMQLKGAI